jgi:hypothetical protein
MFDQGDWQRQSSDPGLLTLSPRMVVFAVRVVGRKFPTCEDFEGLGTKAEFLIHPLVVGASEERHADFEEYFAGRLRSVPLAKGLAADAVGPASALFENGGIPRQIIVNHVPAVTMQVDTFLADRRADQHFGQ